ncbi:Type I Iterative PKS [Purpureocillium takamizusanense]|uniref:Type I Iterative PKS n=1 Tax=Purpureocillium takamizusanense TaxID=2060973 RepID=A0A9Q8QHR7_9HYPO|nr:Type I Iterative PKS [Purpureocillium takamizusanense]UNI19406.1 Type I Iterative PKS [Purpureocillium takamizusanense]
MKVNQSETYQDGDIESVAIVGLAFEFPQEATTEDAFWQMLCEGRSASTEFPGSRLNIDAFYHPDKDRPSSFPVRSGHFVKEDLAAFDAPFFSITAAEAACMDPQHRRMLETAYHALEDAGIPINQCSGTDTAVYTGCFTNDYLNIMQQDHQAEQRHGAMGVAPSMLANRLSWFFDFKGTSMNLDSACSSSLVALHLACQDLRARNASMALVGGANLVYHPNFMKLMSDFNFLSTDSRCWIFDERGNGYARGEGTAVLVIKRLTDALRDGDTIRAVIRNTGSNQDGRTPGITQPSMESQIRLIEKTYESARVDMAPTQFFEAHGTGTPVGDPIEAQAIGTAFSAHRSVLSPLYIGSVKANIGHLGGCSGLAGVIKTILVLENGVIPPIAGFQLLNDRINADKLRLRINSFGFGGTNAVAILDDAYHFMKLRGLHGFHRSRATPRFNDGVSLSIGPSTSLGTLLNGYHTPEEEVPRTKLLIWSCPDQDGAHRLSNAYKSFLGKIDSSKLNDLAYTLAARRSQFPWRSFAVADSDRMLLSQGQSASPIAPPVRAVNDARVGFVFTGQGAHYLGMGRTLLDFPEFRQSIDKSDAYLRKLGCSWSLTEVIDGTNDLTPIDRAELSQPATTCLQIALLDLLASFGVRPSVVLGHSSGEIAAAYAAGALSRSSAIKVAYHRGVLSSGLASKWNRSLAMTAVGLSRDHIRPYLDRLQSEHGSTHVAIGCVNSPKSVTLTGVASGLDTLEQWLWADGVFAKRLRVPIAYHSEFMEAIAETYATLIGDLHSGVETDPVPMISSVTGDLVTPQTLTAAGYWVRNLVSPVNFEAAFGTLMAYANRTPRKQLGKAKTRDLRITHVMEIGPHSALQGPIRENAEAFTGQTKPTYIKCLVRGQDSSVALLSAVGVLCCAGCAVDILRVNGQDKDTPRLAPRNMPRYPFNHQNKYWLESRLSSNLRFPEVARHDLLGVRSLDWNPQVAQWRNVMRLEELPWLHDHTIAGEIVFPAAGYVVMAIESLKQLTSANGEPSLRGAHLKDVAFLRPIRFSQGLNQIETQLTLSTTQQRSDKDAAPWSQFRIFALDNGSYLECCRGFIRAVVDADDCNCVAWLGPWSSQNWLNRIPGACSDAESDPYSMPGETEVRYGPAFCNLERMRLGCQGEAIANLLTGTWQLNQAKTSSKDLYGVHPAAIDGLTQLVVPALSKLCNGLPTMVPTYVNGIWVDCDCQELRDGTISVQSQSTLRGRREASASIVGVASDADTPVIYLDGLETTFINSSNETKHQQQLKPRTLCTQLSWKSDIDLLSREQITLQCTRDRPAQDEDAVETYKSMVLTIMAFIEEAVEFIDKQSPALALERHLQAFVGWMRSQHRLLRSGRILVDLDSVNRLLGDADARHQLVLQVESQGIGGRFFMTIGRNLIKILRGEVDALQLIYHDSLADRYYEQMLANDHHAHPTSVYVDLLSFKNPSMKILEVGAGTGGQTLRLLEKMSSGGVKQWRQYDYTDISPSFFSQARLKFQDYSAKMNFKVCDISKDPATQSFETGTYDLVVASHVLHATDYLDQSLGNIRKLLKPGGKLLLFETTLPEAIIAFAFGLLKGWWSPLDHEARSEHSPCLSVEQWDHRLKGTGFTGVDLEIPGQELIETRYSSIIVSTAVDLDRASMCVMQQLHLVVDERSEVQKTISELVQRGSGKKFKSCNTLTLAQHLRMQPEADHSIVICLLEVDEVFLDGISERDYVELQSILLREKSILWLCRNPALEGTEPRHGLADGLGRVLMSEDSTRKFVTQSLDGWDRNPVQISELVCDLANRIGKSSVEDLETKYITSNGCVQISRVLGHATMDTVVSDAVQPRTRRELKIGSIDAALTLGMTTPGHADTLEWVECDELRLHDGLTLEEDEVVVNVKAIGLSEERSVTGTSEANKQSLAIECAGIVHSDGATSGFKPGDRVCLITPSAASSIMRVKAMAVSAIPSNLSFIEAASIASATWTAYHALVNVARIQEGESVLVHEAATATGQATLQLAKKLGAEVYVTAASSIERELLCNNLNIGHKAILSLSGGSCLSRRVAQVTRGSGVDVVIGPLTKGGDDANFANCLAPFGRLVDISMERTRSSPAILPRSNNQETPTNLSRLSVDMVDLLRRKPRLAYAAFQQAMRRAFDDELYAPSPLYIFAANEPDEAFRQADSPGAAGKTVMVLDSDSIVRANVKTRPRCKFADNATYVIAGGLGGLGRSIARWMACRGAKNLVLLSRSGVKTAAAEALVSQLNAQGVRVEAPCVDIGCLSDLQSVLRNLQDLNMPPIRGCIQAAVVLRDNLFPNMTYEDWTISTGAKVTGSWNLHAALPDDLDFFVLLSSLNGIVGGRAQANYGAGNTFKDALAQHRLSKGQKAVSLDLGLMVAEGIVAENASLLAAMRRIGHLMDIHQDELLALLDYYCDPSVPILDPSDAQVLVGIEMPDAVLAKGVDLHHAIHRPMFRHLFQMGQIEDTVPTRQEDQAAVIDRASLLAAAENQDAAAALVSAWFVAKLAQVLGISEDDIDK